MPVNNAPIPGENMTSDTKSYPWHQPPEFTDLDKALDWIGTRITKFQVANGLGTMAELGMPIYQISQIFLMQGVAEGKWTVDFALMLAGPVARMIELICVGFKIDYQLGIDDDEPFETGTFFKKDHELKAPASFKLLSEEMPEIKEAAAGQGEGPGTPSDGGASEEGPTGAQPEQDLQTSGFMAMSQMPQGGSGKGK